MTNINTNTISGGIASAWNEALNKTPIKQGREKVIKDYFDLYVKSGIMDFLAKEIRKEFGISSLHPDDLQLIVYPINEGDLVEEERSAWYEGLPQVKKEALDNRINDTIRQLYLPTSVFEMFLHYLLYRKTLNHYPFDDTNLLNCFAYGHPLDEVLGYSTNEVKGLGKLAIVLLQEKREMTMGDDMLDEGSKAKELQLIDEQIKLVPLRCAALVKTLQRTTRPLKELPTDIKIIKILRKYKKPFKEFDNETYQHILKRMKSDIAITKINPDIHPDDLKKEAANFRKQVERLKKKFPFLEKLIISS